MTDMTEARTSVHQSERAGLRLRRRYRRERRFKLISVAALGLTGIFLVVLLGSIVLSGWSGFITTKMRLEVTYSEKHVDADDPASGNFRMVVLEALRERFPEVEDRRGMRALLGPRPPTRASSTCATRSSRIPSLAGGSAEFWLHAASEIDMLNKGYIDRSAPEELRQVDDRTIAWVDALDALGRHRHDLQLDLPDQRRFARTRARRHRRRGTGVVLDPARHLPGVVSDRGRRGGLPGGVRAQAQVGRHHRGQHQQPRGRALDRLRPPGTGRLPQRDAPAALGAAGGRPHAGPHDPADHHHHHPCRDEGHSLVDQGRGPGDRRIADPGRLSPPASAGAAEVPDRRDHRHGAGAGRDGAPC